MVQMIMGRDCAPVSKITLRFRPNPSRITAHCRIFFDANLIPASKFVLSLIISVTTIPARMEITGPPMIGKDFPKNQDGIAIRRQRSKPLPFVWIKPILVLSFLQHISDFSQQLDVGRNFRFFFCCRFFDFFLFLKNAVNGFNDGKNHECC